MEKHLFYLLSLETAHNALSRFSVRLHTHNKSVASESSLITVFHWIPGISLASTVSHLHRHS